MPRKNLLPALTLIFAGIMIWLFLKHNPDYAGTRANESMAELAGMKTVQEDASIAYEIIPGLNNTWGYNILTGKKIIIHQPCRPGLPGNEGFKTKEGALKVAAMVIEKIKKGEMPPTVNAEDLENINAK